MASPWPQAVFNVADSGAKGDGSDATDAFLAALQKARKNGGGIVFIPRGTYYLTQSLYMPERTVLRGEGREKVWLRYGPTQKLEAVIRGKRFFAVEDLSIAAQMVNRVVAAPDYPNIVQGVWGSGNGPGDTLDVSLRRLRIHHVRYARRWRGTPNGPPADEVQGMATVALHGQRVEVTDCDIVSPGYSLSLCCIDHSLVARNRLRSGRSGGCGVSGARETVLEENRFEAADLEGSGVGVTNFGHSRLERLYFAHNRLGPFFGGEREALTFDTGSAYRGFWKVEAADARSVSVRGKTWQWQSYEPNKLALMVIAGRGLGQHRVLADKQDNRLVADAPWDVVPDATSAVAVAPIRRDVTVYSNEFEDASVFVQLWGPGCRFIIDGNHGVRAGGAWGRGCQYHEEYHGAPGQSFFIHSWFNQWFDNVAEEPFVYDQGPSSFATMGLYNGDPPVADVQGVTLLGNVFRRNICEHGPIGIMYYKGYESRAYSEGMAPAKEWRVLPAADNIFEHNVVKHGPLGYVVETESQRTLLRGNATESVKRDVADAGQATLVEGKSYPEPQTTLKN